MSQLVRHRLAEHHGDVELERLAEILNALVEQECELSARLSRARRNADHRAIAALHTNRLRDDPHDERMRQR
jgi:hypothetical protein